MDKHVLHNIIHRDAGSNSKDCPVCNGALDMEDNEAMMSKANDILERKQSAGIMFEEDEKEFAELNSKKRNALADSEFAYIDSKGGKHLPINDANHVRNALARFDQTQFDSESAKSAARSKILAKAKELGVDAKKMEEDADAETTFELRPLVDVMSFAEGEDIPTTIKLIPVGKYKMNRYGDVDLSNEKLAEMIKHFEEGIRAGGKKAGLPIDIEHGATQYKDAAAGWIKGMSLKEGDGVYGQVDWTSLGKKLLKDRIYKFYSPEFFFDYKDPQHGFNLKNVMTGGGLVNKPMIKDDLPAIVNSETASEKNLTRSENAVTIFLELENNSHKMQLSEILKKEKSARTSEEQAFVAEHKGEMTFDEAKKEGLAQDFKEEKKVEPAAVKLEEGQVVVSQEKLDALSKMAEEGKEANDKLKRAALVEEVKKLVFSEKGTKLSTDQIEVAADLLMGMGEEAATKYKEQLKSLPEAAIMGEAGTEAEVTGSAAGVDLDKKARELVEKEKITYAEAISRTVKENPAQFKEFNENMPVAAQER